MCVHKPDDVDFSSCFIAQSTDLVVIGDARSRSSFFWCVCVCVCVWGGGGGGGGEESLYCMNIAAVLVVRLCDPGMASSATQVEDSQCQLVLSCDALGLQPKSSTHLCIMQKLPEAYHDHVSIAKRSLLIPIIAAVINTNPLLGLTQSIAVAFEHSVLRDYVRQELPVGGASRK